MEYSFKYESEAWATFKHLDECVEVEVTLDVKVRNHECSTPKGSFFYDELEHWGIESVILETGEDVTVFFCQAGLRSEIENEVSKRQDKIIDWVRGFA